MLQKYFYAHENKYDTAGKLCFCFEFCAENVAYLNADGGHLGQERTLYRYDEAFPAVMERIFGERKGKYIFIEK